VAGELRFAVRCHQGGWTWDQLAAVWREAGRLGYDGASLYDLLNTGVESWTALTALVNATRLTGIPMVLANPYRPAALVAKMAATLDLLSEGRLILGLGSGGAPGDAAAYGVPWTNAVTRTRALVDGVRAMRMLWNGGGSYEGEAVALRDASGDPRPFTPGGPPVLIGGHGRRHLLRAAAQVADFVNIGADLSPDDWAGYRALIAGYCREIGRDPAGIGLTHNATVLLAPTAEQYDRLEAAWAATRGLPLDAARDRLRHALAGTPEALIERIRGLRTLGIRWIFLIFQDLPALGMARLFAERVLPAVR
jgi:alkanesulfonate monooxygenase SsuD/methylene tetrahydromethanopterin reductase-like flavin-dependent oxidoreductase (luciferase family)